MFDLVSVRPGLRRGAPPQAPEHSGAGASGMLTARQRAWLPILWRVAATGLALLGFAGIGAAAGRSPGLVEVFASPVALGAAQLAGPTNPTEGHSPPSEARAAAPAERAGSERPCPKPAPSPPEPDGVGAERSGNGLTPDGRVILNRASAEELLRLPGVGAQRARAIVELRRRLGRFRRPSDLLRIKGIGRRTLERMLPSLVLDAPP